MPKLDHGYSKHRRPSSKHPGIESTFNALSKERFEAFAPAVLGLGDIGREGKYVQALVAILDLEGFTTFCNQVDPHLVMPEFLTRYLDWFFATLRTHVKESETDTEVRIWGSLPFFVKFLGDGLLLIWDTADMPGTIAIWNTIAMLHEAIGKYVPEFLPEVRKHVTNPPTRLRCGVARGQILSVGDDGDYVGSCINIAARLQKLNGLSFAISRRGLDPTKLSERHYISGAKFVVCQTELRGIGHDELVIVQQAEVMALAPGDKELFRNLPQEETVK